MFPSYPSYRQNPSTSTPTENYKYSQEVRTNAQRKLDSLFIDLSNKTPKDKKAYYLYQVLHEAVNAKAEPGSRDKGETVDDDYLCG